ncbi:MAG: methyltransferase domain-containing protein [Streptococcus sp.]|nr:methyltransferase domain-containing protein [Streptococcus sp.]
MGTLAEVGDIDFSAWGKRIPKNCLIDRDSTIVSICKGKSVLHIGAADSPFHEDKAKQGILLHQKVEHVASELIGVDVDQEAIEDLKKWGVKNIILGDIQSKELLSGKIFDVVLCCDVIEHVDGPRQLLDAAARFLGEHSSLIITTINATAAKPVLRAIFGYEAVHPDHICYFSFGTLFQLIHRCKLKPEYFGTFNYPTVRQSTGALMKVVSHYMPGLGDGIMAVAKRTV